MDGQNEKTPSFGDPATEPIDLAQAFKMVNQANRAAAEDNVDTGNVDPETSAGEEPRGSGDGDIGADENQEDTSTEPAAGGDEGIGEPSNFVEPIDFNARKQEVLREIQQDAINLVRKDFADNQITPCTIEELYVRDENTGRVTFKNPDDPSREFDREAAQKWVDAFNKQIEMRFRQEVNKKQQELVVERAPMLRVIEFAPKFEALDQTTKEILDDLIEPYAVTNRAGEVIGFNVNLDAALAQAQKIAKRFNTQQANTQNTADNQKAEGNEPEKQGSRPAMNMPTGTGKSSDELEPKNIGEALKMYDKSNREKGKR